MKISGKILDLFSNEIYFGELTIAGSVIEKIERTGSGDGPYILPGLIDSHIHIESSMLTPGAFAYEAVRHGTVAVVSDPHEIANVLGLKGVEYMINDAKNVPLRFFFGAPSCVPATSFETSGSVLSHKEVDELLSMPEIMYLSEMMNFSGVIYDDPEVKLKLQTAVKYGKPIDGHAPGLRGEALKKYIEAGISTDHECTTIEEAREKIAGGMKILIREGSAARNLDALKELYNIAPQMLMLCSDDLHPETLAERHINKIIARLIREGYNLFDVIRSATLNPSGHYSLNAGLLREGQRADFILVDELSEMNVYETWINGEKVFDRGIRNFNYVPGAEVNNFNCLDIAASDLVLKNSGKPVRAIEAYDGELVTGKLQFLPGEGTELKPDTGKDLLKIVVKDRYTDHKPVVGFIKGFGLKKGAFASSVSHDSHNIIAIGTDDREIAAAINEIVRMKGGLSVCIGGEISSLSLNIAGIMTTGSCTDTAEKYKALSYLVQSAGCRLTAPFMTLSFMALLVIPELKISDRGLFDTGTFSLVPLNIS